MLDAGIRQNLLDAGCSDQFVQEYERLLDPTSQLRKLKCYRRELLAGIHSQQRKLDCLDYLIFSINKNQ